MDHAQLDAWCHRVGITTHFGDRAVPDATKHSILAALGIDPHSPPDSGQVPDVFADPASAGACHMPDWLAERPAWGLFCQLYELRSARNWGIGDFRDLADLAGVAAAAGADFLGINPMHALFLADPARRSPFTPSNRRFLNPLYIAMDDLPGPAQADPDALAQLHKTDLVDYATVADLKRSALRAMFDATPFADTWPEADFAAFTAAGGAALERHALFEAISARMVAEGHDAGWRDWPAAFQNAASAKVARFAKDHAADVRFHIWLQWIASRQLDGAKQAALDAGMRIGLYLDFAVGEAPDGSATWSAPDLALRGLSVGAPPDVFAQSGQNWNLSAPSPTALDAQDFAPFRALIAAQMHHAGALRIDHVMGLKQLFVIPEGQSPDSGTHLAFPFADMLRVVAEESRSHGSVLIGEDLGWVPPGFRETMQHANMLAYRILYFEQEWGLFRRTGTYPEMALACISTHDLPTLDGWWQGEDISLRHSFGLIDDALAAEQKQRRVDERTALVAAFVDGGQMPPDSAEGQADTLPDKVRVAAYRFLAQTRCRLVGVRLADLVGPIAATNVPGTTEQFPNWQRRSPTAISEIADADAFRAVTQALREVRPRET